ncbi:MAG TPA: FRG domain-containing protein [Bryobacterales bacterium]|nr:FRG domain-containing protein [Bryobacterales bacterium]
MENTAPEPNDLRVSSWTDLVEQLYHGSWDARIERYRSNYAFRGLSIAAYDMKTSLIRMGGDFVPLERHLLRNFRKYAHRDAAPGDSVWNWLSVAQHRGLPTRLLDWTYSPFVAMHFATANVNRFDVDGVVWCVDYVKTNQLLPEKLRAALSKEGSHVFTVELLDHAARDLETFDGLTGLGDDEFVVFLESPSLDERIVNQYAFFSLLSNPRTALDSWLANHPELYRRIIIPAELKWEVRDKLDQANINERVLFPGLDGLSRWLTRHYSPKNAARSFPPPDDPELR